MFKDDASVLMALGKVSSKKAWRLATIRSVTRFAGEVVKSNPARGEETRPSTIGLF